MNNFLRLIWLNCFLLAGGMLGIAQEAVIPYPDNSMTLAGFQKNGLPAIKQVWSPKEYEKTFQLLSKIYEQDKYSMPRFKGKDSAALFDRLIAKENFDYLLDSNYTLKDRVIALERYAYIPARLMLFYLEEKAEVERYGAEVLAIMELSVQLTNNAVILIKELKESIEAQANSEGFKKAYEGIIVAHEDSVKEILHIFEKKHHRFNAIALENYAYRIVDFFPKIWQQLEQGKRKTLLAQVKSIAKTHSNKKLKKPLKKLCKKLKRIK